MHKKYCKDAFVTYDWFFEVIVGEGSNGMTVEADFRDGLGPPVDDHEGVVRGAHADARDGPALQPLVDDVAVVVEVGRQPLDPAVARVDDEHVVALVHGHVAGLAEPLLFGSPMAEADQGRVVLCHVEEQRAVFDGPVENHHLKSFQLLKICIGLCVNWHQVNLKKWVLIC